MHSYSATKSIDRRAPSPRAEDNLNALHTTKVIPNGSQVTGSAQAGEDDPVKATTGFKLFGVMIIPGAQAGEDDRPL